MCIVDTVPRGQSIWSRQVDFATRRRRRWAAGPALLVLLAFTGILLAAPSPAAATSTSVISYAGRDGHVYRYDVATGQRRSMNLSSSAEVYWSPDGHYALRIPSKLDDAYDFIDADVFNRWTRKAGTIRTEDGKPFPELAGYVRFGGWSQDGTRFALAVQRWTDGVPSTRIYLVAAANRRAIASFACSNEARAAISPDGARLIYSSGGSGADSLWMYDVASGSTSKWIDYSDFSGYDRYANCTLIPYWPPLSLELLVEVRPPGNDVIWRRHFSLVAVNLTSKSVRYLPTVAGAVYDASRDGRYVLVESQPWDVYTGQFEMDLLDTQTSTSSVLLPARSRKGFIKSARLSPDGSMITLEEWFGASLPADWRFDVLVMPLATARPRVIGHGKCPTWIPAAWPDRPATRADLVTALKNLKKDVKVAENRAVKNMAMALAAVSIDRRIARNFNWLAFFWKTIRSASSTVLTVVDNLVGMGASDFALGKLKDDPQLTQQALTKYGQWAAENAGEMGGIKAYLFASGVLGNWRSVNDYELFCDGYSELSTKADGWRKRYGPLNFSDIYQAMIGEVAGSDHLTVPLRKGAPGPTGVPGSTGFASTPNRLLTALNAQCDAAIAALPDKLPAGLDVDALVAEINQVRATVRKQGIHSAPYPSAYQATTGWVIEERKVSLGLLDDEYELMKDLEDCFVAKLNVQTTEAIQGGAEWPVMWITTFVPLGQAATQLTDNLDLAANVYLTGQSEMAPESELKPIEAMNQLETKMLLDTKTELARLYQLTAGLSGYVRSETGN
jgi:hypothetical protein